MWTTVLLAYVAVGLIIMLSPPARKEVWESMQKDGPARAPVWKIIVFRVIVCLVALLFWPIFLPSWFRKKRSVWDALQENPIFQQQKALFDAMILMCEDGCETDEIPGGYGEFGHEVTNPIPTKTVFGSTNYLARLRASDGTKVLYERRGSTSSPVSSHPVDEYVISQPDGRPPAVLRLAPSPKRNSEKAPPR